jgi:hypothetical protein
LAQFFCEFSCPNRREFIRKFFEFAPRGAFQARIPGDFSPFLAKPGICLRRNIALGCGFAHLPRSLTMPQTPRVVALDALTKTARLEEEKLQ